MNRVSLNYVSILSSKLPKYSVHFCYINLYSGYICKYECTLLIYYIASATVPESDITDEKGSSHLTNGRAKNGSSVHLLDEPVMVNAEDMEGTGTTLNAKRDDVVISVVQPSASANADISKYTKINSPKNQRSFQNANVAVSISPSHSSHLKLFK